MVTIDCPCCDSPMAVELPLPDTLRCDDCAVSWSVADPAPQPAALAA